MRILLAVDGSDQSYQATRALEHLAPPDQLIVLHALDVPQQTYPFVTPELPHDMYAMVEQGMRDDGERLLKRVVSLLPPNLRSVSTRLEIGKATELILSLAAEERPDLILMGSRGVGLVRELTLGSVSYRIASHAPCPTLVVRRPLRAVRSIVVAVEHPEDADAAMRFLSQIPFAEPCEATVLIVLPLIGPGWPVGSTIPDSYRKEMLAQARNFAEEAASRLNAIHYRASGVAVTGAPAIEILEQASKSDADLILVGSRRRRVSRFVLGSVSHAVLHRAACPVLVFR